VIALSCFGAVFLALWGTTYALFPPLVRHLRSGASRFARWLRCHARLGPLYGRIETWRSHLPLVLALALGALVVTGAAGVFADISGALRERSAAVQQVDAAVFEWFGSRRTAFANALFVALTTAGGPLGMGGLAGVVFAVLLARRRLRWAAYLAITSLGGVLLNQLLKVHYLRQRPDASAAVLGATGYSFPSGHAMNATIILGALAYLAARSARGWRSKSAVLAALATLALAIGISRLYLGVHWTSDVAAGFAAGLLWLAATTTGYELVRQYRLCQADRARCRATAAASEEGGREA
jgi:membrane-associated phospholipid phosphatase